MVRLYLIVWIIVSLIVAHDARKRGMSEVGWFCAVFFLGLIGLIIYLVVRSRVVIPPGQRRYQTRRICRFCGRTLESEWLVCPYCGTKVE